MPDAPSAPSVARALLAQARQTLAAGQVDAARRQWEAALQLGQSHDLADVIVQAQHQLAAFDLRVQDLASARKRLDDALILARGLGEDAPLAAVAARLGQVLIFLGEPHNGVAVLREARGAWERVGQPQPVRELELAIQATCAKVDAAVDGAGADADARLAALWTRARVQLAVEDGDAALRDLGAALPLARGIGRMDGVALVGSLMGQLLHARGNGDAVPVLNEAAGAWRAIGEPDEAERLLALLRSPAEA